MSVIAIAHSTAARASAAPDRAHPATRSPPNAAISAASAATPPSPQPQPAQDRKSTRLNSSHGYISYAVFCLKKKKKEKIEDRGKLKQSHVVITISLTSH